MQKDGKIVFALDFSADQDKDVSFNKVTFGEIQERCHEQVVDWNFFTWEQLEPLFYDFVKRFCTYDEITIRNTRDSQIKIEKDLTNAY